MILVVEDSSLGEHLGLALFESGLEVSGPWGSCEQALAAVAANALSGAVLDFEVIDGTTQRVAAALARQQVPFCYLTGVDMHDLPADPAPNGYFKKPARLQHVIATVRAMVSR